MGTFDGPGSRRRATALLFPGRPPLAAAVPQSVGCHLRIRVPTCGLHAKGHTRAGDKLRSYDLPALVAAKELYAQAIPHLPSPVAGPLVLHCEFVLAPKRYVAPFAGVLPFVGKPDRANLVKLFEDCLRAAGWMVDDAPVVAHPGGKWISQDASMHGVWFVLETLQASDEAATFKPPFPVGEALKPRRPLKFLWHGPVAEHRS